MKKKDRTRNRIIRRVSSPPEILYAVTRHWFIVGLVTGLGAVVTLGKLLTDPPIFEARATITLSPEEALVTAAGDLGRLQAETFFHSRVSLLASEQVVKEVVRDKDYSAPLPWRPSPRLANLGPVGDIAVRVRSVIEGLGGAEQAATSDGLGDPAGGADISSWVDPKTIQGFLRRIRIDPDPRARTVRLSLLGADPIKVKRDMERWVAKYADAEIKSPSEKGAATVDDDPTLKNWKAREEKAERIVGEEVMSAMKDYAKDLQAYGLRVPKDPQEIDERLVTEVGIFLAQEIQSATGQLDDMRDELRFLRLSGVGNSQERRAVSPTAATLPSVDLVTQKLRDEALVLQGKLRDLRSRDLPETNNEIRRLAEQLRWLEEDIADREAAAIEEFEAAELAADLAAEPGPDTAAQEERKKELEKAIEDLRKRKTLLETHATRIAALRSEHAEAVKMVEQLDQQANISLDLQASRRKTSVQWSGSAAVSPYEIDKRKLLLKGVAAAAAAGVFLALLLELLNGKVRFQSDLSEEFGIPVVGVIPRK